MCVGDGHPQRAFLCVRCRGTFKILGTRTELVHVVIVERPHMSFGHPVRCRNAPYHRDSEWAYRRNPVIGSFFCRHAHGEITTTLPISTCMETNFSVCVSTTCSQPFSLPSSSFPYLNSRETRASRHLHHHHASSSRHGRLGSLPVGRQRRF